MVEFPCFGPHPNGTTLEQFEVNSKLSWKTFSSYKSIMHLIFLGVLMETYLKKTKTMSKNCLKKLSLPLFPRNVAKIKKTNWPTVQKVG